MRVSDIVTEGLRVHEPAIGRQERDKRAVLALQEVLLDPDLRHRFPRELSGGQRQRVAIARAMILKPRLVVLDEPTSALDRSVQTGIIGLLEELQEAHGLTYIFISHDLAVIRAVADEIAVMKDGRIVEQGPAQEIVEHPREPYSKGAHFGGVSNRRGIIVASNADWPLIRMGFVAIAISPLPVMMTAHDARMARCGRCFRWTNDQG
jgi:ABC-type microcin C transport system duplicated ATPase subunit YejF